MSEAGPERICGQRTNSGNYCENPMGECPYHDPPAADVDADALREQLDSALDYAAAGDLSYAMKFVRRARAHLD